MQRVIGVGMFSAVPAAGAYGLCRLFGASNKVTAILTMTGAVLGAATVITIVEALKKLT